jgi:vancomycin resistance protein YoaR
VPERLPERQEPRQDLRQGRRRREQPGETFPARPRPSGRIGDVGSARPPAGTGHPARHGDAVEPVTEPLPVAPAGPPPRRRARIGDLGAPATGPAASAATGPATGPAAGAAASAVTEILAREGLPVPAAGGDEPPGDSPWKQRLGWHDKRPPARLLVPAAVLAALVLGYLLDVAVSAGDMPRGTRIAGVDVGGLSKTAAATRLRAVIEPRKDRPVPVRAGTGADPVQTNLEPATAGLKVDYPTTLKAADDQPLNPFTRFGSFFTTRERPVIAENDNGALGDALEGVGGLVHRDPVDAGVRFDGTTPVVVQSAPGQDLDVPAAVYEVRRRWLEGNPIVLPLKETEPAGRVTDAAVQQAIKEVAEPAVSGDVRVVGEGGHEALLTPTSIAGALSFAPDGSGGLKPVVDLPKIEDALRPQLAVTERPGQDATVRLVGDYPEVVPSTDGHGVDYPGTLAGLVDVLKKSVMLTGTDSRRITAIYADQPAKITTEQVEGLGIRAVISTFSTSGFAKESGQNIKRAAESINGKILMPGDTFSLNEATGPREAAEGYVDAGIIQDGHPARGVGGGVSQLATTLYNAAYFAGMTDVAHKEHSYYISRYPQAREATVYEGAIDLKFRNDSDTGVLIQTVWTASSITVKFLGTKHVEVTSQPGEKTDLVPPQTITIPAGKPCQPSDGGNGFTTSDTKTVKNLDTGQSTSTTRRVKYKPSPKIVCAGGPMPYPTSGSASTSTSSTGTTTGTTSGSAKPSSTPPSR